MGLAKSTVQVSIVSQLGQGFNAAFQAADTRMAKFRQSVTDASRAVGNIDAYRKQQDAVKQAGYSWQAAKAKADQFRQAIAAQGAPTRKQAQELARLEQAAARAGDKFSQQRQKLGEMARALQQAGINTGKLSAEYTRLTAKLAEAEAKHTKMEASLARQQRMVTAMGGTWRGIASAAAGVTAGAAVLAGPTRKAMTYDEQLSYMSDTATQGAGPDAYKANKKLISDGVDAALKYGGGKREDSASALSALIASGKFDLSEALVQLKEITRTATASGASSEDLAKTVIAMKNNGIANPGAEFDKLLRAGQLGNFELKDMAKYLPDQFAMGRAAGFNGQQGVTDLLAFNQVAMKTAGTADDAGRNVINLLQKFSSAEFSKSIAKNVDPRKGDPTVGGKKGAEFDWSGYAIKQREKGVNQIDAFVMLMERELANDKRYQGLQKKLKSAGDDNERKQALEGMSDIAMGSQVGQIIADRQALLGALASIYGKDEMGRLKTGITDSAGAVEQSSANIRGETWSKANDAKNAVSRANEQSYNAVAGPLGKVLEFSTGLATEFPNLTTAVYAATAGLGTFAAAAGAWGLSGKILGSGATAAAGAGAGAATATGAAAGGAGALATIARLAGPAALVATMASATSPEEDATLEKMAASERAKKAELTQRYGGDTLQKAYKQEAPWYQFGGVDNAKPELVEQYVKAYLARMPAAAGASPGAAPVGAAGAMQPPVQNPLADKVIESSTAATEAARAAGEAATAAQNRPNIITQSNSYVVTVQAPDMANVGASIDQALRTREKQKDAELRASFMNQPRY